MVVLYDQNTYHRFLRSLCTRPDRSTIIATTADQTSKNVGQQSSASSSTFNTPTPTRNLLLVLLADSRVVGIRADRGRPKQFANDEEQDLWVKKAAAIAFDTKSALEKGTLKVEDCSNDLLVVDPIISESERKQLQLERQFGWWIWEYYCI